MGFKVVINFIASDKFTKVAEKVKKGMRKAGDAVAKTNKKMENFRRTIDKVTKAARSLGFKLVGIGTTMLGFGALAVKKAGDMQLMRLSLDGLTRSTEKGAEAFKKIKKFTGATPFQLGDVNKVAGNLISMGITGDKLMPMLTMIGNVAAGKGSKTMRDYSTGVVKALGVGKLNMEILNLYVERGVNLWPQMEIVMGKTKDQIVDLMAKGKVGSDVLIKSLRLMTDEGGIFYQMMEKMSKTMPGRLSTLSDNFDLAVAAIGQVLIETFKLDEKVARLTERMIDFTEEFPKWAEQNRGVIEFFGQLAIALTTIGVIAIGLGTIGVALKAATFVGAGFAAVMNLAFAPITLILVGLGLIAYIGYVIYQQWDNIVSTMQSAWGGIKQLAGLVFGGKLEVESTQETRIGIDINDPGGAVGGVTSSGPASFLDLGGMFS